MQVISKYYIMYSAFLFVKDSTRFVDEVLSPNISVRPRISVLKKVKCASQKRRPQLSKASEAEASGGNRLDEIMTSLTPSKPWLLLPACPSASLALSSET